MISPPTSSRSFTPSGMPSSGRASPRAMRASAARASAQERVAVAQRDDGVQVGVRRVDAAEHGLHQLDGGHPPLAKGGRELHERRARISMLMRVPSAASSGE